ncbi:MAG: hypothetical protein FWD96_07100, partial [Defluviitaleaceae bacterium]|nr:hypothetical protein [Defluviitaleaceae bacterium]
EKEITIIQHDRLFDLLELDQANSEKELRDILSRQIARAEASMSKEEIALVRERVASLSK